MSSSAWNAHRDSTPPLNNSRHSVNSIQKLVQDAQIYSPQRQQRLILDVYHCCRNFNGLEPKLETFSSEVRDNKQLLTLKGVIPIVYRSKTYQIPVTIYCPALYPEAPPIPYVSPTDNMVIRENHANVNKLGRVYIPHYLSHGTWNQRETLQDLARTMVRVFSHCPPVNSRSSITAHVNSSRPTPARPSPTRVTPSVQSNYPQPSARFSSAMSSPASSTASPTSSIYSNSSTFSAQHPTVTPMPFPHSPASSSQGSEPSSSVDSAQKSRLVKSLSVELTKRFREAEEQGIAKVCERTHQLDILGQKVKRLSKVDERQGELQRKGERLRERHNELTTWMDSTSPSVEEKDIDMVVQFRDMSTSQIAECSAHDNALGDVLDQVDEALVKGVIDNERYVVEVRELARQQFYPRALKKKLDSEIRLRRTEGESTTMRATTGHVHTDSAEYEALSTA